MSKIDNSAPDWQLVEPLQIVHEQDEDGCYVVSDGISVVYGVGDTLFEAQQDYLVSLIEYCQLLAARDGNVDWEPVAESLIGMMVDE